MKIRREAALGEERVGVVVRLEVHHEEGDEEEVPVHLERRIEARLFYPNTKSLMCRISANQVSLQLSASTMMMKKFRGLDRTVRKRKLRKRRYFLC